MDDWEGGPLEESGKLENPAYRCKHGTYIGDPYGPDLICMACELGDDEDESYLAPREDYIPDRCHTELIRETTEMIRMMCVQSAPRWIKQIDDKSELYLGVTTGYHGVFEFKDADGKIWSVSVELSKRLGAN